MNFQALGDRMKGFEKVEAGRTLSLSTPIIARLDGRSFHNFTRGMERPFDFNFSTCMINTTEALVQETGACIGYTQSDEISLAWLPENPNSQIWFNGRVQKMVSQLAAQATLKFIWQVMFHLPDYVGRNPSFDARVWSVPNRTEGANAFLWRELDATKNSISMAAHSNFSNSQLHGKHSGEKLEMLRDCGIEWDDYPTHFKRGTYVQRRKIETKLTSAELELLPPKHAARMNPDLIVTRSVVGVVDMPPLKTIANPEDVIFQGATPILK